MASVFAHLSLKLQCNWTRVKTRSRYVIDRDSPLMISDRDLSLSPSLSFCLRDAGKSELQSSSRRCEDAFSRSPTRPRRTISSHPHFFAAKATGKVTGTIIGAHPIETAAINIACPRGCSAPPLFACPAPGPLPDIWRGKAARSSLASPAGNHFLRD